MDRTIVASLRKRLLRHGRALIRRAGGAADPLAALDQTRREELALVHAALERIERGRYGRCTGCGGGIALERLELAPWQPCCHACTPAAEPLSLAG